MPFQWSNSADWTMQRCQRKLWFQQVYASPTAKWGSPRREAKILANVQTVEQWQGFLAHFVISNYLVPYIRDQGKIPHIDALSSYAMSLAEKQLAFSRNKRYREPKMSKTKAGDEFAAIWEDEFDSHASKLSVLDAMGNVRMGLNNLLGQDELLRQIRESQWIASEIALTTEEDGIKVTGRVDLAFALDKTSPLTIVDWKFGSSDRYDNAPQLWLYAYLFEENTFYQDSVTYKRHYFPHWLLSLTKQLLEVNLLEGKINQSDWDNSCRKIVQERIFQGVRKIQAILDGRDSRQIKGEELSVTNNPRNCQYCTFRELCQKLEYDPE